MKDWIGYTIVGALCFFLLYHVLIFFNSQRRGYDCTWVEISPDIPPYVREKCRELRSKTNANEK